MERRWHLWEAIERCARRRCAAAATDVGISILLVLFTVFFLAGATIAVVFAARPFPKTAASSADATVADAGQPVRRTAAAKPPRERRRDEAEAAPAADAVGLRLSRAPDVLREQFGLGRGVGLVVEEVSVDSFAARAGFKRNDVLVSLDDQLLMLPDQVPALFEAADGEAPCRCRLLRGGKPLTISLSPRPKAMLTSAVAPVDGEPDQDAPTDPPARAPARKDPAVTTAAPPVKAAPATPRAPAAAASKLRVAASVMPPTVGQPAIATKPADDTDPAGDRRPAKPPKSGLLMRVAEDTLLQQDSDYQIKVMGGSEKRLVVRDSRGRIIFNDAIETPEQRTLMPLAVRDRVERMERLLAPPSDAPRDEPEITAAEAVVRGPDPARVEWRRSVAPAGEDRPAETTAVTDEPVAEIGHLDIDPVEIR